MKENNSYKDTFEDNLQLLQQYLADNILKNYKAESIDLNDMIIDSINKSPELITLLKKQNDLKKILRTKVYKDFSNTLKRKIYIILRKYHQNELDVEKIKSKFSYLKNNSLEAENYIYSLLESHVSTKERLLNLQDFYEPILPYILSSKTFIDIGCGLNPLMFPFNADKLSIEKYIAVDKDKISIEIINQYAAWIGEKKLTGHVWDISEGFSKLSKITGVSYYDFAFIMKVIPVVKRQERHLLSILASTPAKLLLLTGSKTSMTKKLSIENRERRDIIEFINENGFEILLEFNKSEEFGWLVKARI